MKHYIQTMINSLFILTISLPVSANEPTPATLWFDDHGFTVTAPAGTAMLEVRLMGPERSLIFSELSEGQPIDWQISDAEIDGDYRYEAVVVINVDGKAQQSNWPGGFEVIDGRVIAPPQPVATEADIESLLDDHRAATK